MSTIAPPIGSTPPVDIEAIERRLRDAKGAAFVGLDDNPAAALYTHAREDVAALLAEVAALRARRTPEEERADVVAYLRRLRDAEEPRLSAARRDNDLRACRILGARVVGLDEHANAIERGEHLPPPPAADTTTDIRTEPSTGRVASRYEP